MASQGGGMGAKNDLVCIAVLLSVAPILLAIAFLSGEFSIGSLRHILRTKPCISDRDTNVPGTLPGVPPRSLLEAVPGSLWVDQVFVWAHAHFFVTRPRAPTHSAREG